MDVILELVGSHVQEQIVRGAVWGEMEKVRECSPSKQLRCGGRWPAVGDRRGRQPLYTNRWVRDQNQKPRGGMGRGKG